MSRDPANLEFTVDEMHAMIEAVARRAIEHIAHAGDQPICGDVDADAICRTLREPVPEEAVTLESLLGPLFDEWVPRSFTTIGPGYLAFIPGGGIFPAALADFIAATTNRFTGVWMAAPALVQLEANALEWLRSWMDFPDTTAGLLTTGGSLANFNAIVCARERWLGPNLRNGVLYTSDQVHHSVVKSARLAGILPDRVRLVESDRDFRMRVDRLATLIDQDRRAGLTPFLVVSTAGTTNTGAVDPLDDIADLCAGGAMWHHIDGAYGAFFYACEELRPLLKGLSRGDSLTLDPHKGMFLPYGTGALLVRDGAHLRAAHEATASYLPHTTTDFYDPSQYGPELSRPYPGLRVWLALKLFGARRYKTAIAEKRRLALEAAAEFATIPGLILDAPPQLSLFAFHLTWPGATRDQEDVATRRLLDRVTARGRVMLTGCTAGGRFVGRVCVLSFRTRDEHMQIAFEHTRDEAQNIIEEITTSH